MHSQHIHDVRPACQTELRLPSRDTSPRRLSIRGRGQLDLERARPKLAGNEEMIGPGVISNPVRHRLGTVPLKGWQEGAQINPADDLARARRDPKNTVRVPDIREVSP